MQQIIQSSYLSLLLLDLSLLPQMAPNHLRHHWRSICPQSGSLLHQKVDFLMLLDLLLLLSDLSDLLLDQVLLLSVLLSLLLSLLILFLLSLLLSDLSDLSNLSDLLLDQSLLLLHLLSDLLSLLLSDLHITGPRN